LRRVQIADRVAEVVESEHARSVPAPYTADVLDQVLQAAAMALAQSASATPSSPSSGPGPGGIASAAGLIVLAVIVGGLLVMRNRLLRR